MENWEKILIFILVIVLFVKFTNKEHFYGWIPISTRNTHNMSYVRNIMTSQHTKLCNG